MTPLAAAGAAVAAPPPTATANVDAGETLDPRTALDDTAESPGDAATALADAMARRAELMLLATQGRQHAVQARLDRMRADFNATQEERAERMRELNALRDMAMEQNKHDDEILKKFIAMI